LFLGYAIRLELGHHPRDLEKIGQRPESARRTNADPAILSDVDAIFDAMARYHPKVPY
jgi:hypothetical protein